MQPRCQSWRCAVSVREGTLEACPSLPESRPDSKEHANTGRPWNAHEAVAPGAFTGAEPCDSSCSRWPSEAIRDGGRNLPINAPARTRILGMKRGLRPKKRIASPFTPLMRMTMGG